MARWAVRAVAGAAIMMGGAAQALDAPTLTPRADLGFNLAEGFEANVFATDMDQVRQMARSSDGRMFVILRERVGDGDGPLARKYGLVALADDDGDGVADRRERFGDFHGSGVGVRVDDDGQEWLYASSELDVWRWPLADGELAPQGERQRIATGFPRQPEHPYKPFAFDGEGAMHVMVGAPSNACMKRRRKKGSPGQDPCPQLDRAAGVWTFDADTPDQRQEDAPRYATGLRNAIAFAWSETHDGLYAAQHGRDVLSRYFPELFDEKDSAELPSEEFFRIDEGDDLGWPYSYHDWMVGARMVMPEYGGDGRTTTDDYKLPIVGFPGHWAPSGLTFIEGPGAQAWPQAYRGAALLVFKGGWNRAPLPQGGFRLVVVPLAGGDGQTPSAPWITFADGFGGSPVVRHPTVSKLLPMGAYFSAAGELFIGDERGTAIWRITPPGFDGNAS